jgi:uncharacterized membrane protein
MTTAAIPRPRPAPAPWPEQALSGGCVVMLALVLAGVWRGRGQLAGQPWAIQAHLAAVILALTLTPVMLLPRKGTPRHRVLGYVWLLAMAATAGVSLFVRVLNPGHFSPIHILSLFVLIQVPLIVYRARTHQIAQHQRAVRLMVLGALLIAGAFTFPFNRLLGRWLFGG